jgi:TetR/AcrR family transcriptional regulator, transcriptional repressor for nem operon
MARRSAAQKAETREHIVRRASEAFRAHGSTVGIGDVMKELGLTHGGFYRHFANKEELLIEAVEQSLVEVAEKLERATQKAPPGQELAALITAYLSLEHLRHPESWCVIAALAPEIGRQPASVRKRLDGAMQQHMRRLSRFMPGTTDDERAKNFLVLFSGMAGAIALTRVMGDKDTREHILAMTCDYYLKTFADPQALTGGTVVDDIS